MLFNSITFLLFLILFFILYWFICHRNLSIQNSLILVGSYIFYGWWDWRFLSLIILSSLIDYIIGIQLIKKKNDKWRKFFLTISILINIGFLGVFKYYNFFVDSFLDLFSKLGYQLQIKPLQIILPVGISFYTFQTLSYSIDVYKQKLKPTKNIIAFFAFVSFFPQLVAGPIERAKNLLPQFEKKRTFNYNEAVDGLRQALWGFFKKIVIADNCAILVNNVFGNYQEYAGSTLILAAIFFAFQIYCDFSGYSDIAIGTAKLFGFKLMTNFAFPYFSRNIAEFWRRWHISLSTWFRDYVYIPIGGSRGGIFKKIRNTFVIFIISGFWHGANWTFIAWGVLHAIYFLPLLLAGKNRKYLDSIPEKKLFPSIKEIFNIFLTFALVSLAWIFFRAENLNHAFGYIYHLSIENISKHPGQLILFVKEFFSNTTSYFIILMLCVEWIQRTKNHALEFSEGNMRVWLRWSIYIVLIFTILLGGNFQSQYEFIYFQF